MLGSLLASSCYIVFKALDYAAANSNQDSDENRANLLDLEHGSTDHPDAGDQRISVAATDFAKP